MKTMRSLSVLGVALVQLACGGGGAPESLAASHGATVVPPEWNCATTSFYLGRSFGEAAYLVNDPVSGAVYSPIDAAGDSITLTSANGIVWSWTSTALIRAVFIRADLPGTELGDATNQVWLYVPPQPGGSYVGSVYTEDSTNLRYPAKQIEFCFDPPPAEYRLEITKTARMSYERKYEWTIDKRTAVQSLTLAAGETYVASFEVEVAVSGFADAGFAAEGEILIVNPAPIAATITGVSDELAGGIAAAVACPVTFPYALAAGASLTCTWSAALPDGADRADAATVTTTGAVLGGAASAVALAAEADVTEVDDCATVSDDHLGPTATVCAPPFTFGYTLEIGPYEACGSFEFTNVASLVTDDTGATASDSVTIPIEIPCDGGCTLTPGYWKTHSRYGPAPYDDTWALVGEDTPFFLSGFSWYGQFGQEPSTNVYFQLSHQYAAAALNALNSAATSAVNGELKTARDLLATYTPAQVAASRSLRARFVALAATLDAYNNGVIGPGHCDW